MCQDTQLLYLTKIHSQKFMTVNEIYHHITGSKIYNVTEDSGQVVEHGGGMPERGLEVRKEVG